MARVVENLYIQNLICGDKLPIRSKVRVATTVAGTLSTDFENGDTIDGVLLATGDRILIKNQVNQVENGIYNVQASGSPSRTFDFDPGIPVSTILIFVTSGTVNAQTSWLCTNAPGNDTIDIDNITFEQTTGKIDGLSAGSYTNADIIVDDQGRITSATNGIIQTPALRAYRSSGGSMPSSYTNVGFDTVQFSRGLTWDTGTSSFTPPSAGYYKINTCVTLSSGSPATFSIRIMKNGSTYAQIGHATNVLYVNLNNQVLMELTTSDTVTVESQTTAGGYGGGGSTEHWIEIMALG